MISNTRKKRRLAFRPKKTTTTAASATTKESSKTLDLKSEAKIRNADQPENSDKSRGRKVRKSSVSIEKKTKRAASIPQKAEEISVSQASEANESIAPKSVPTRKRSSAQPEPRPKRTKLVRPKVARNSSKAAPQKEIPGEEPSSLKKSSPKRTAPKAQIETPKVKKASPSESKSPSKPRTARTPEDPNEIKFSHLNLHPLVFKGVQAKGHESPTPIQAKAIPVWLEGSDIVGSAQTGTGKTAAFALPILSQLESWRDEGLLKVVDKDAESEYRSSSRQSRSPRGGRHRSRSNPGRTEARTVARPMTLIIEPTRELANQVLDAIREYGTFTSCKTSVIYGGVGYGTQRAELANDPEIIVATPGRLLDYVQQGEISLKSVKAVILDEADRMLDMGFLPDVRRILEACPPPNRRQTGFFSATLPPAIQTLVNWAAKDPVTVSVDPPKSTARTVQHALYPVAEVQKAELLLALLEQTHYDSVIVFCRTRRGADRVGQLMKSKKHSVGVLHSDHNQKERELALKRFRSGEYDALVATDIASRGLDIADVTHVINYDIPENAEDYVHRIGRTGRAKSSGDAFTLYTAQDAHAVQQIERYIDAKIVRRKVEGFDYRYTALFDEGKGNRPTLASGKFKSSRVRGGYVFGMSSRRKKR